MLAFSYWLLLPRPPQDSLIKICILCSADISVVKLDVLVLERTNSTFHKDEIKVSAQYHSHPFLFLP